MGNQVGKCKVVACNRRASQVHTINFAVSILRYNDIEGIDSYQYKINLFKVKSDYIEKQN